MTRLRVAPIVEGHGEYAAIRLLLQRVWHEIVEGEHIEVLQPIRRPRSLIVGDERELVRAVELAVLNLDRATNADPGLILILLDADEDAVCVAAPELLKRAGAVRPDRSVRCVLANREYETWFVAAAESLTDYLDRVDEPPTDPESAGLGKAWVASRFRAPKYSPRIDQPRLTAAFDLHLCRRRSPSFDKLCRELEAERRPSR